MAETIIKTENLSYVYSEGTPYEHRAIDNINIEIEKGSFGADMKVTLLNDGPVTIILDTDVIKPKGEAK